MKISKIEDHPNGFYRVYFVPTWLGKLFGRKACDRLYKKVNDRIIREDGTIVSRISALDYAIFEHDNRKIFRSGNFDY